MKTITLLPIVVVLLFFASTADATTYYVRTDGNNSNTGLTNDSAGAWLTISRGVNATGVGAGDTLRVQAGTYNESATISNSGNVTSPIIIIGDNNPILDGGWDGNISNLTGKTYGFTSTSDNDFKIFNFTIRNYITSGILLNGARNVTVQNNTMYNIYGNGVQTQAVSRSSTNISILNNIIRDSPIVGAAVTIDSYTMDHINISYNNISNITMGNGISWKGGNNTISFNYIDKTYKNIITNQYGRYTNISNNYLKDPNMAGSSYNGVRYDYGTLPDSSLFNTNNIIENNTFVNASIQAYDMNVRTIVRYNQFYERRGMALEGGNDSSIYGNIFIGNVSAGSMTATFRGTWNDNFSTTYRYHVFNNTFLNGGRLVIGEHQSDGVYENNIFSNWSGSTYPAITFGIPCAFDGNAALNPDDEDCRIKNITIQSNTFYKASNHAIGMTNLALNGSFNISILNNIFSNISYAVYNTKYDPNNITATYNLIYGNTSPAFFNITHSSNVYGQNPLFYSTSIPDFHLRSAYGRWNGTTWVTDAETSPAIGAGDPTSDNSLSPWGGIIEMGAYGNTAEASAGENVTLTIPPLPINLAQTNGRFWANYTWQAGSGVITNSYNISQNGTWTNGSTDTYKNNTVSALGWSNITIFSWNSTGLGNLSTSSISMNTQVPDIMAGLWTGIRATVYENGTITYYGDGVTQSNLNVVVT